MKHMRLIVALAVLCLLAGSAFAVSKLMPAIVDQKECIGCGECVEECPEGAITLDEDGLAVVDEGDVHWMQEMHQSLSCRCHQRGVVLKRVSIDRHMVK